jgi:hypothetical protein
MTLIFLLASKQLRTEGNGKEEGNGKGSRSNGNGKSVFNLCIPLTAPDHQKWFW